MTSQSRRKRPTTRPSSRRMSRVLGSGFGVQERTATTESLRKFTICNLQSLLRTNVLALLTLVAWLPMHAAASELRWRSDRTMTVEKPLRAPSQPSAPTNSSSALRFVRPQTSTHRDDPSVRLAAFEDNAPRLTSGRDADTQTRSVMVNRDNASDSVRSAQLRGPNAGSTNSQSAEHLQKPFGDLSANEPQLQTPQFDTPPMPNGSVPLPAPQNSTFLSDEQQHQPAERQPRQSPPAEQPVLAPTAGGQFQPVLPSGPTPPEGTGGPAPIAPTATVEAEKGKAKESCDKSLENLRAYTVDKVNLNISVKGTEGQDYPFECSIDDGQAFKGRCWEQTTYLWKASAMCHKPLYFEDEQLERYGHSFSPCFQPVISGAHFFTRLPVLPYCMGVEPPCECIYALGHYRPGSCAPYMCNPIPLSPRGALIEAGAVTGAAMALP